ncbi:MAG: hemerythrin domain-containing protein, partial [Candidatus Kapaibacterium sp.]
MPHLPDPNKYSDPIRYFRDSHALIITLINQLEDLIKNAEAKGIKKSIVEDNGWHEILEFLVDVAPIHEQDEEMALFPIIFEKVPHVGFQLDSSPVRFIHEQHDAMQMQSIELLKIWKQTLAKNELTDDEASRFMLGAKELAAIYREHVRRENEIIYTAANDELLSPQEREAIMNIIREHHGAEVITPYFEYEAPVISNPAYSPTIVAGNEENEDAISQEELEVEEDEEE